jgi:PAS domain-containing protein
VAERTAALSASETKFRLLVEQSPDGIFVTDHSGHYIDVNSIGGTMLGYSREELLALSIPDVVVEAEQAPPAGGHCPLRGWQRHHLGVDHEAQGRLDFPRRNRRSPVFRWPNAGHPA